MDYDLHLENLKQHLADEGIDIALIANPENVHYISGFYASFYDHPGVAIVSEDTVTLIVPETAENFKIPPFVDQMVHYCDYNPKNDFDMQQNLMDVVSQTLKSFPGRKRTAAAEMPFVSAGIYVTLEEVSRTKVKNINSMLKKLRMIKTGGEIERIKRSVSVANAGHKAARKIIQEGSVSELEAFNRMRLEMEKAAGERILMKADILSGPRTAGIGGAPTDRIIEKGDLFLADLIICAEGYWADTTSTSVCGEPTQRQKQLNRIVVEALRKGLDKIKPGIKASQIDREIREYMAGQGCSYPHHSGHSFGLSDFECPIIGPDNDTPLEKNMVLTLEPGLYDNNFGGIRIEHNLVVTHDGPHLLSSHSEELVSG